MIKKLFLMVFGLIATFNIALAQNQIIGKFVDDKGSPLESVTVTERGINNATQNDVSRNFKLKLKNPKSKLVFSLQAYTKKEVDASENLQVVLDPSKEELCETVVSSLGIKKEKKGLTYAATDVKEETLQQKSENDVLRSLNGKVPSGVDITGGGSPDQSTRITIRATIFYRALDNPLILHSEKFHFLTNIKYFL